MNDIYCKLPKHLRRKWGREIRRGKVPKNIYQPTRKGKMLFQHHITKLMLTWWRRGM